MSSSIDSTSKNYNLNITRALQKKLEATKRNQHVEYKYTSEGMVVTADTATFELIRIAQASITSNQHNGILTRSTLGNILTTPIQQWYSIP